MSEKASPELVASVFGEVLRRNREDPRVALTQDQLAEVAGYTGRFIRQLESGQRRASLNVIVDIARALGVSSAALIEEFERVLSER